MNVEIDRQVAVEAVLESQLPSQTDLERWVAEVLRAESDPRHELTIRFVESEESRQLNRDYRGKDKPTNVLSFPFETPPGIELPLLGDLVICHAVVVDEALAQRKTLLDHYAHLVIHGCLHLLGHDHIDEAEAEQMEALERSLLARFDIADPYRIDELDADD
ncbi:rRNA maturation RNase YbeY [Salinicola rhizosphaerae]|uniref:Endoribonuclease YbeY n=1 Tax=Salinicola rhizosphaerae TaxID=1443141 RepID=A0ABQ3DU13_9GAMM|nr:rRNA maturation RNase YbeY [Salinicola rhizosphaerae]GHB07298.1 endoribonuclease YbeY [Salinicola rhizosphaerae]